MGSTEREVELLIRSLEPEDSAELARLQAMPGYRLGTLRPPFPRASSVRQFLERLPPDDLMLGAFSNGVLVGSASLHRFSGRRQHAAVLGIGVADHLVGRGIGTALINETLQAADCWLNVRRMELTVFADNDRAIRLYQRHGFEQEGLMRAYAFRDGSYADVISMARIRRGLIGRCKFQET